MCCIFKEFSNVWKCFSNPDLRRSELSLDAMLQRTSSNSSSSSSPSSQGGSAERRGNEKPTRSHIHTVKYTDPHACMRTFRNRCMYSLLYTCKCGHRKHRNVHIQRVSEAISGTLSVTVLLWSTCRMCPVTLSLRRYRREEMREVDRERRTGMCQTTGQRDI